MRFLIAFLLPFLFAGVLTMPLEGAVKSFLGIEERDIDISADPRKYKPRRWLKDNEKWHHLPTSTLEPYHWHHHTGAPHPTGYPGQNPWPFPFPIPDPFHHHKGGHHHHDLPFPFNLLPWPLNQLTMEEINNATPEQRAVIDTAIAEATKSHDASKQE